MPALAHTGGVPGGLESGLEHSISGLDHVVAMISVGLWGGILGKPALWLLPVAFPVMMALSGVMGMVQVPLPGGEIGIALCGIVLGVVVLFAQRPPLAVALALVGFFAIFHGDAHGAELPGASYPVAYAAGFVVATGLLHLIGVSIGYLTKWPAGMVAVRAAGAMIAIGGAAFLTGYA